MEALPLVFDNEAHPVDGNSVGYGFSANVPYARAFNPVTKTNWETIGVRPDIRIGADSALDAAVLLYYEFALRQSSDSSNRRNIIWSRDMLLAKLHPVVVEMAVIFSDEMPA